MLHTRLFSTSLLTLAVAFVCISTASAEIELTTNGDFEAGDTSGWEYFPSGTSSFAAQSGVVFDGVFSGLLDNQTGAPANPLVKQANLGVGVVQMNQDVTIDFWARGSANAGGVHFAEFFTEIDGGGVSSSQILGGAPLFLTDTWTQYSFVVNTGANDVSGGVTLQLAAITGGDPNSTSTFYMDNVSVSVVPEPASAAVIGIAGLALIARRRRR